MPLILPVGYTPPHGPDEALLATALPAQDGAGVALPDVNWLFLVFTQRTGSNYFAGLLASAGGFLGDAHEDFQTRLILQLCAERNLPSLAAYAVDQAAREARHGWYATRLTIRQLLLLAWTGLLERLLPRSRFIVLYRADTLAQAISWHIADTTGSYISGQAPSAAPPDYDRAALHRCLRLIAGQNAATGAFMAENRLAPLFISYEEITANPTATAARAYRLIGQPQLVCRPERVKLQKQGTALNAAWRARWLAGA